MNDIRMAIRTVNLIRCEKLSPKNVHKGIFTLIIKSLQKQIPKKPIFTIRNKDTKVGALTFKKGVKVFQCSQCKSLISSDHFCRTCGQALDWSVTDEHKSN
jgi:hypothetical protein